MGCGEWTFFRFWRRWSTKTTTIALNSNNHDGTSLLYKYYNIKHRFKLKSKVKKRISKIVKKSRLSVAKSSGWRDIKNWAAGKREKKKQTERLSVHNTVSMSSRQTDRQSATGPAEAKISSWTLHRWPWVLQRARDKVLAWETNTEEENDYI